MLLRGKGSDMLIIRILKKTNGQVLVLTAFAVIALFGVTALAIDLSMDYAVKAKLNSAVDAAALAAGKAVRANGSASEAQTAATNYFNANFPTSFMRSNSATVSTTATKDTYGVWSIGVTGSAVTPSLFGRIFGITGKTVAASATAVSRTVDILLVLDLSSSLQMSGSVTDLKNAAKSFVDVFSETDDRVGLVVFASGAIIPANCAISNPARGYVKNTIKTAIDNAAVGGSTNAEEAMRIARAELNAIPSGSRNSLRTIVFFSDGSPNIAGTTLGTAATPIGLVSYPHTGTRPYPYDLKHLNTAATGTFTTFPAYDNHIRDDITSLNTATKANANSVDLSTYVSAVRTITFSGGNATNNWCNVNKAARSQLEYFANQARTDGIIIYSIGLGNLSAVEETSCGYSTANESGEAVLRRVAASPGVFVNATVSSQLNSAFQRVASMILRLTPPA